MGNDDGTRRNESRLNDLWREIDPPSIDAACRGCEAFDDATLERHFLEDLRHRARHRLKITFEEYCRAVGHLRDRPHAATAVFVHEILQVRPENVEEWANRRKASLPEYAAVVDAATHIADLNPVRESFGDGRYVEIERLGAGGFGRVVRAHDKTTNSVVAVKVFNVDTEDPRFEEAFRRFARESELLGRLAHPSIARLLDIDLEKEPPFLVLEYVDGWSLERKIRREAECRTDTRGCGDERARVWIERGVRLIENAARTVHFAHKEGVLHRDLKPDNIIETPSSAPILIDFGLAAEMRAAAERAESDRSVSSPREFRGTPEYAAPETIPTIGRRASSDRRTDVYGLGAVLHAWIALRPPFLRGTHMETLEAVLRDDPPSLAELSPHVSTDLDLVVRRAMAKDPAERYTTAEAFADDLARVLRGERPTARPFSLGYRVRRYFRRDPKIATATAVTITSLLLATGTALWFARESRTSEETTLQAKERADASARHAESEANRAREAERELLRAVAEEYQARMATTLARADHIGYLTLSKKVVADRESARAAIKLQRVRCALAIARWEVAQSDLALLSTMRLDAAEQALFDLLYGERAFLDPEKSAEARASIEKARASGKLLPADDAYARGLIETTTRAAAEAFREGIRIDPSHRGCRVGAAFVALTLGDISRARIDADGMASVFPADAFPNFIRLWCAVIDENISAIEDILTNVRVMRGDASAEALGSFVDRFRRLRSTVNPDERRIPPLLANPSPFLTSFRSLVQAGEEIEGTGVEAAVVARLDVWGRTLLEVLKAARGPLDVETITSLAREHPDGFLAILEARAHADRAMAALRAAGMNATQDVILKWKDSYDRMVRAMRSPSFIRDSRRMAAKGAVQFGGILLRPDVAFDEPDSMEDELDEAVTIFLRERRPNDPDLREVVTMALSNGPLPSVPMRRLLRAWEKESPASADVLAARIGFEIYDERLKPARSLLGKFRSKHPTDSRGVALEKELSESLKQFTDETTTRPASGPTKK